jgi:hypothetical protein
LTVNYIEIKLFDILLKKFLYLKNHKTKNMKTKASNLNKKLKSYSAIAGTMVAAANTGNAQVVYTNVTPDASVNTGGTYDLDLDNNGSADFQFAVTHTTYMYGTLPVPIDYGVLAPMPGNAIDTTAGGNATAHALNDPINGSLIWADDAAASYQLLGINIFSGYYTSGNFLGQNDQYIGLRFKIGANDHYGWARIDMDANATLITLKDYAYDATPNAMIPAGATVTGINENAELANNVAIFSTGKAISVDVKDNSTGIITVTNTLGQEISKMDISDSQTIISMENASAGIYFVTVSQASAKVTKKVVIK